MLIIYWDKFKLFLFSCCAHPHPSFVFRYPLQVLQVTSVVLLLVVLRSVEGFWGCPIFWLV